MRITKTLQIGTLAALSLGIASLCSAQSDAPYTEGSVWFLKEHKAFVEEHRKVDKLEATVAGLVATVKEQASQIQKVSAQLEVNRTAPQIVLNNQ
jgi:hypothetical protein